jgi:hypothetical protein
MNGSNELREIACVEQEAAAFVAPDQMVADNSVLAVGKH